MAFMDLAWAFPDMRPDPARAQGGIWSAVMDVDGGKESPSSFLQSDQLRLLVTGHIDHLRRLAPEARYHPMLGPLLGRLLGLNVNIEVKGRIVRDLEDIVLAIAIDVHHPTQE